MRPPQAAQRREEELTHEIAELTAALSSTQRALEDKTGECACTAPSRCDAGARESSPPALLPSAAAALSAVGGGGGGGGAGMAPAEGGSATAGGASSTAFAAMLMERDRMAARREASIAVEVALATERQVR